MTLTLQITDEQATLLREALESDMGYYISGLTVLNKLKRAKTSEEFTEILNHYKCPTDWTNADVERRFQETKKLVDLYKYIRNKIVNH